MVRATSTEDEEGVKHLAFKLPENDFEGNPNKITMYNVSGKKVDDWDKLVGNGSTVKIKYRIAPYYMASTKMVGISFKFYACQVITLVEFKKQDSGFGDETSEDGAITSSPPSPPDSWLHWYIPRYWLLAYCRILYDTSLSI